MMGKCQLLAFVSRKIYQARIEESYLELVLASLRLRGRVEEIDRENLARNNCQSEISSSSPIIYPIILQYFINSKREKRTILTNFQCNQR